jgi:FAD-binding 9, siderophore-interacting domain protein
VSYAALALKVVQVENPLPGYARIWLSGPQLHLVDDGGLGGLRDTRIKLIVGAASDDAGLALGQLDGGWYHQWLDLPVSQRGYMRTYTVACQRHDQAGKLTQIAIDILIGGVEPGVTGMPAEHEGPGVSWARQAKAGASCVMLAPWRGYDASGQRLASALDQRGSGLEYRPGAAKQVVLLGDGTALPAINACLHYEAQQKTDRHFTVVLSGPPTWSDYLKQAGVGPDHLQVTAVNQGWVEQAARAAAQVWQDWLGEVAALGGVGRQDLPKLDVDADILWETTTETQADLGQDQSLTQAPYFWVAGERSQVAAIRRALVRQWGVDRRQVSFMGYWRAGQAES